MTRTEIRMVVDSAMEFYPNLIVGDIYHALHEKPWYRALTSLEVGSPGSTRGYLIEAPSIAAELYQAPSAAKGQVNVEQVMERLHQAEADLADWTRMYMALLKKYTKLEKEQRGGM